MSAPTMTAARETRLRSAVEAVIGDRTATYQAAAAPVASPIRRAVEHDCLVVHAGQREAFVTVLFDKLAGLVDTTATAAAARSAHAAGVAPAVLDVAEDAGAIAYALLPETYQWARTHQLRDPDVLRAVVSAKRAVHAGPPLTRDCDIFADVERLHALALDAGAALPTDFDWMLHQVRTAGGALRAAGRDVRPCHRDGTPSNVMLGPGGTVQLVDFDVAGNADPHHDIAALLGEVCQLDDEWREAVEMIDGRCDQQLLARYRLNAAADDLAWGIWGLLCATLCAGQGIEYFKYGQWRLLRCRYTLQDRQFEMWSRTV